MTTHPPPAPSCAEDGSYYDLGSYSRPVTTASSEARVWFDRGLIWSYAFNHEEAVACFERAIALDPCFAMAYWGLAYALGPNYNKPWEFFEGRELQSTVARTHRAVEKAAECAATTASPVEATIIKALKYRYPVEHLPEEAPVEGKDASWRWAIWNVEYADAMGRAHQEHPTDLDVAALYVDALMNLTPWKLWNLRTGEPAAGARTLEAKRVLDTAFQQPNGTNHPGLLHYWIHLMEMSSHPEAALEIADNLRLLVPDAGHLNHMPSHLDVLCGRYKQAVEANTAAILADEKFAARAGPMNFYTLYRSHDYHFRIYSAMFSGQSRVAIDTALDLERSIPPDLLRVESPPMADWLEGFLSMLLHVYIRFGRWSAILSTPFPDDADLYCTKTATLHYARAIAFASLDRVDEADAERAQFTTALTRIPESRTIFNNTCVDVLTVASAMLDGEIEYRRGNYATAFAHLRRSTELYDNLPYDEPWGFMQPTRHALSALLLEQSHVEEAAVVYEADLGVSDVLPRAHRHPNNVWSLRGYHECLIRLGRHDEAKAMEPRLKEALQVADVPIKSSCFCRLQAAKGISGVGQGMSSSSL
ncbi:hypothetical protein BD289DRAFT_369122 [Coniella lustricola]|uniref:Uncharacterized protein n=1 Tax=Coniella lustricola TaxID=2025994 RepID=A0A2T3A734_9PEZI|nr:hypothetical protein BD289DRAFT_369122 [Coniella lustricola]